MPSLDGNTLQVSPNSSKVSNLFTEKAGRPIGEATTGRPIEPAIAAITALSHEIARLLEADPLEQAVFSSNPEILITRVHELLRKTGEQLDLNLTSRANILEQLSNEQLKTEKSANKLVEKKRLQNLYLKEIDKIKKELEDSYQFDEDDLDKEITDLELVIENAIKTEAELQQQLNFQNSLTLIPGRRAEFAAAKEEIRQAEAKLHSAIEGKIEYIKNNEFLILLRKEKQNLALVTKEIESLQNELNTPSSFESTKQSTVASQEALLRTINETIRKLSSIQTRDKQQKKSVDILVKIESLLKKIVQSKNLSIQYRLDLRNIHKKDNGDINKLKEKLKQTEKEEKKLMSQLASLTGYKHRAVYLADIMSPELPKLDISSSSSSASSGQSHSSKDAPSSSVAEKLNKIIDRTRSLKVDIMREGNLFEFSFKLPAPQLDTHYEAQKKDKYEKILNEKFTLLFNAIRKSSSKNSIDEDAYFVAILLLIQKSYYLTKQNNFHHYDAFFNLIDSFKEENVINNQRLALLTHQLESFKIENTPTNLIEFEKKGKKEALYAVFFSEDVGQASLASPQLYLHSALKISNALIQSVGNDGQKSKLKFVIDINSSSTDKPISFYSETKGINIGTQSEKDPNDIIREFHADLSFGVRKKYNPKKRKFIQDDNYVFDKKLGKFIKVYEHHLTEKLPVSNQKFPKKRLNEIGFHHTVDKYSEDLEEIRSELAPALAEALGKPYVHARTSSLGATSSLSSSSNSSPSGKSRDIPESHFFPISESKTLPAEEEPSPVSSSETLPHDSFPTGPVAQPPIDRNVVRRWWNAIKNIVAPQTTSPQKTNQQKVSAATTSNPPLAATNSDFTNLSSEHSKEKLPTSSTRFSLFGKRKTNTHDTHPKEVELKKSPRSLLKNSLAKNPLTKRLKKWAKRQADKENLVLVEAKKGFEPVVKAQIKTNDGTINKFTVFTEKNTAVAKGNNCQPEIYEHMVDILAGKDDSEQEIRWPVFSEAASLIFVAGTKFNENDVKIDMSAEELASIFKLILNKNCVPCINIKTLPQTSMSQILEHLSTKERAALEKLVLTLEPFEKSIYDAAVAYIPSGSMHNIDTLYDSALDSIIGPRISPLSASVH